MSEYIDEESGQIFYENVCTYLLLDIMRVQVEYPYICLGEVELYTE